MNPRLIAAATVGASRGIIEYELHTWPVAATAAGIGLSIAVQLVSDRPQVPSSHGPRPSPFGDRPC
jgi:hypothetical protein